MSFCDIYARLLLYHDLKIYTHPILESMKSLILCRIAIISALIRISLVFYSVYSVFDDIPEAELDDIEKKLFSDIKFVDHPGPKIPDRYFPQFWS